MKRLTQLTGLILALGLLTACSHTPSSAERHAKRFVYNADDNFSPNYQTNKQESVRLAVPYFAQFYNEGKKDKAAGLTPAQAQERANYLRSDAFIESLNTSSTFAGKSYQATHSAKWNQLMKEEASGAYLDGYEGRE